MPFFRHFAAKAVGALHSLEWRLAGALGLIALGVGAIMLLSQHSAMEVRSRGEALGEATGDALAAHRLTELVTDFRIASNQHISGAGTASGMGGTLTDIAIEIGEQVTVLRLSGSAPKQGLQAFEDMDRQVASVAAAANGRIGVAVTEARNREMSAVAFALADRASARRLAAQRALDREVSDWQLAMGISGGVIVLLVIAILLDLLRNILPALRRMHGALRRLAEGDLDFNIERHALRELQALSGPLETFRRHAQAVKNLAFTDPSTGLPNRRAFMERVQRRLARPALGEARFAVLAADIDRFKHVNDDFGHAAGDRLVQEIAARMIAELGDDAIVARIGGDEYAICVALDGRQDAVGVGARLVRAMRTPFDLGSFSVTVSLSVGSVEVGAQDAEDVATAMHRADLALYAAKSQGRNCASGFTEELEQERELEELLERDLSRAMAGGQLRMVYQPIHALSGPNVEVEALVRWRHPTLGEVPPPRFIAAAERSGLMVELGAWIIERTLSDLSRWPSMAMSINLSPLQLQQDGFVAFLLERCRRHAILPQRLILEVTETLSIERNERALLTLELLRGAGCRIALDDFGTGYSSLCMMKMFRFDRLKLDRSLIADLDRDETARAVFDAAVTMARRVGAQVVAEGISDELLVAPVTAAGCTHVQGFHFSRPIEAEAVPDYFGAPPLDSVRVA